MVAGASVAGAMTMALGHAVKYAHENNIDLTYKSLTPIYKMFLKNNKQ